MKREGDLAMALQGLRRNLLKPFQPGLLPDHLAEQVPQQMNISSKRLVAHHVTIAFLSHDFALL
jgi:hypothetical protein